MSDASNLPSNGLSYKHAGVDIDAGNALVEAIKPAVRSTRRAGADAEIGGFGGLFDLKAAGFKDPVLVAATDGVGTKVKIAIETGLHAYDIQALIPLIENAGGVVTNWEGGSCDRGGDVLACGDRALHAELLDRIAARR